MPAKKKPNITARACAPRALSPLVAELRGLILSARHQAASTINTLQVLTNFEIGRRIVEHEQKGAKRAAYGTELLKELSARLTEEFGKGFSERNLEYMRKFFLSWKDRVQNFQQPTGKLRIADKSQQPAGELVSVEISQQPIAKLLPASIGQSPADQLAIPQKLSGESTMISAKPTRKSPFTLSWTHYVLLLGIKEPDERSFYEIEATSEGWSVPELRRQVASCLYERLALSRNKVGIKRLAQEGQIITRPEDIFKEPLVLEFLGMDEKAEYSESDLETAIINQIERFLLELGKGFLFEARQKRFTFDEDHYYVDLVFYNRLLRCYVLIDLKLDKLTHQDLGQMQMYVNHYDREVTLPEENPTIGIVLCKRKKDAIVELTLPKDANIHAKEYKLYLPSKAELKRKLLEWGGDQP
jgi:predicted nuclease of restriction endonuclease-like (RecB) superfamily